MPFPRVGKFGIVENPLIFTPFEEGNDSGGSFASNDFLLMDGEHFLLMDGEQFLLMNN